MQAESYTDNFPAVTAELERELRKTLPIKYLIIDNDGTAYCTACEEKSCIPVSMTARSNTDVDHRMLALRRNRHRCDIQLSQFSRFAVECKSTKWSSFCQTAKPIILYIRFYTVTLLLMLGNYAAYCNQ